MHISKPFSLRELTQFKGKFILYLRLKTVTYAGFSRQKNDLHPHRAGASCLGGLFCVTVVSKVLFLSSCLSPKKLNNTVN